VLAVLALSMGFAALNGGQRVVLRLGFATLYGVPLTVVAFGGLVAGMVIMLGAGIHSDLKVRRILRARLMEEDLEERARFVDRSQQDLFEEEERAAKENARTGEEERSGEVRIIREVWSAGEEDRVGESEIAGEDRREDEEDRREDEEHRD